MNITEDRIITVFDALRATVEAQATADEAVLDAKQDLALRAAALTIAGQSTGKNDTEREASKRAALPLEYVTLNAAERAQRVAKVQHELANLALDQLKLELRTAELAARTNDYVIMREPNGGAYLARNPAVAG